MNFRLQWIPALAVLALFFSSGCSALDSQAAAPLQASGIIEATQIHVAPQQTGQVVEVAVGAGDPVTKGEVLLRLDGNLLQAQEQAAQAELEAARKAVNSAQTNLDAVQTQYDTVLATAQQAERQARLVDWKTRKPSEFDLPTWFYPRDERYRSAQNAVEAAKADLEQALANLNNIKNKAGTEQFLTAEGRLSDARLAFEQARQLLDEARSASDGGELRDAAQTDLDQSKTDLEDAQTAYDEALTTEGAGDVLKARARWILAQERYDLAQDALRSLQTGERAPEVQNASRVVEQARAALDQAQARVVQAQAAVDLVTVQAAQLSVRSPQDGTILTRSIQPGEVLQAGMTALTLADLDQLRVTVYIPEDRYGEIQLGQQARMQADSFPGESFSATVTNIADQAEFTPRNVQTKEERQTTVYAVELSVDNPGGRLKPGMPVDVTF